MPRSETLLGGATGGGLGLLAPHIQNVMQAWVSGQWTPEAINSKAAIYTAIATSLLGLALVARNRLIDDIQSGRAGGFLQRVWRSLKPEVRRTSIASDDKIIEPLERE
jgi:hypothetical protein